MKNKAIEELEKLLASEAGRQLANAANWGAPKFLAEKLKEDIENVIHREKKLVIQLSSYEVRSFYSIVHMALVAPKLYEDLIKLNESLTTQRKEEL